MDIASLLQLCAHHRLSLHITPDPSVPGQTMMRITAPLANRDMLGWTLVIPPGRDQACSLHVERGLRDICLKHALTDAPDGKAIAIDG